MSGHMSESMVSSMGTPSIFRPTSLGSSENLANKQHKNSFFNCLSVTHSFARRLVTSSMRRAARVTFRVAFLGRIRFSPEQHCAEII